MTTFETYVASLVKRWEQGTMDANDLVRELRTALREEAEITEGDDDMQELDYLREVEAAARTFCGPSYHRGALATLKHLLNQRDRTCEDGFDMSDPADAADAWMQLENEK